MLHTIICRTSNCQIDSPKIKLFMYVFFSFFVISHSRYTSIRMDIIMFYFLALFLSSLACPVCLLCDMPLKPPIQSRSLLPLLSHPLFLPHHPSIKHLFSYLGACGTD